MISDTRIKLELVAERPGFSRLAALEFVLLLAIIPHAFYLAPWVTTFAVVMGSWRLLAERYGWAMPRQWAKLLLAALGLAGVLYTYRTLNGSEAGTALLILMISIKLTETHTLRDSVLLVFLGYFLILSEFLYSQEIPVVIYMMFVIWAITAALLMVSHSYQAMTFRDACRRTARYLAQALPLALVLFILFPRLPGPLWGLPTSGSSAVTGLSDEMTPGNISNLVQSDEVAFRVKFEGSIPPPSERYWRGPVLQFFNGRSWTVGFSAVTDIGPVSGGTEILDYEVTIEPHNRHWMFTLEYPSAYPHDAALTYDYMLRSRRPITQRKRYHVSSMTDVSTGTELKKSDFRWNVRLPSGFNPRAQQLAQQWQQSTNNDWEIVQKALHMFREQPFVYTLRPPLLGRNSVDDFLFDTQRGFCEHYASAFTALMRAAGVPARVVTGYQGGQPNTLSDYYIVRQSDAHAWAEVWLEDRGWQRVDPTAAVAPSRIELGLSYALPASEALAFSINSQLLLQLELRWDSINATWNEFFLAYGPELQRDVMTMLGLENPEWENLTLIMVGLLTVLLGLLSMYLLWMNTGKPPDLASKQYLEFCRKLKAKGVLRMSTEGPLDFAARATVGLPNFAGDIDRITDLYIRIRYGGESDATLMEEFSGAVKHFRA